MFSILIMVMASMRDFGMRMVVTRLRRKRGEKSGLVVSSFRGISI